jgi:hypothetical protein
MLYSSPVINWLSLVINSFWIFGLAVLLAAFSYHYWLAIENNRPLRVQLNELSFLKHFWLSFLLIGIGLVGTSREIWEILIWTFFTLLCLYNLFTLLRANGNP